ncbi:MAG: hypothetical protein MUE44_24645 [Oscillatoriaceae cyanobacterium Prado104]|nr:hypothetical protein [Oscillatoriaceae cyanobacterium Prado104]
MLIVSYPIQLSPRERSPIASVIAIGVNLAEIAGDRPVLTQQLASDRAIWELICSERSEKCCHPLTISKCTPLFADLLVADGLSR